MILDPEGLKWFATHGLSTADAVRALRPGSILERILYATHCTGCGRAVRHTLRALIDCDYRCGLCGGRIDSSQLAAFNALGSAGRYAEMFALPGFTLLPEDTGSDRE